MAVVGTDETAQVFGLVAQPDFLAEHLGVLTTDGIHVRAGCLVEVEQGVVVGAGKG
ncbi:hypothetical protein D3C80_2073950 [compost metagenome]